MGSILDEAQAFLEQKVDRLRSLSVERAKVYWDFSQTSNPELAGWLAELSDRIDQLFSDSSELERVEEYLADPAVQADRVLHRRLKLLGHAYLRRKADRELLSKANRLSVELASRYNRFRPEVDGKPITQNEIVKVLRTSTDSDQVRRYWEAQKQVGVEVAEGMVELARLRNQIAEQAGFPDYFTMNVVLSELDPKKLAQTMAKLEQGTRPLFVELKEELDRRLAQRFGISVDELRPWHYANPWFQDVPPVFEVDLDHLFAEADIPAIAERTFSDMGLEISDVLGRSSLYEREGKGPGAFCLDIDRRGDVRISLNLRQNEQWMSTTLHELGHAAYDKYIDPELPWDLRRPAHSNATEAIAIYMQSLTRRVDWLAHYVVGEESPKLRAQQHEMEAERRAADLIFVRWGQVMYHFESQMYADPEQDLPSLWYEQVRRFQLLTVDDDRLAKPDWASKLHIVQAPCMYHNYSYGHMIAAQLRHRLMGELGLPSPFCPRVGSFLREHYFAPGASLVWDELIEQALGEPLNPRYWIAELTPDG